MVNREELEGANKRLDDHKAQVVQRGRRRGEQKRHEEARKRTTLKGLRLETECWHVQGMTHEIVEERTKAFDEKNPKSIGELVKPLKSSRGFRKQLRESEKSASQERIGLTEQVKNLSALNTQVVTRRATNTRVKGESKTRGNWGEMVLARVLEPQGSVKDEGEREVSTTDSDGKRKRPDVIVHLPGDRQVVIDAKVTLNHYGPAVMQREEERSAAMKRHIASIRGHVKGLASRNTSTLRALRPSTTCSCSCRSRQHFPRQCEAIWSSSMRPSQSVFSSSPRPYSRLSRLSRPSGVMSARPRTS